MNGLPCKKRKIATREKRVSIFLCRSSSSSRRLATIDGFLEHVNNDDKASAKCLQVYCAIRMLGLLYMENNTHELVKIPAAKATQQALTFYMCYRFQTQSTWLQEIPRHIVFLIIHYILQS